MKSNYKKLGSYIRQVDERNKDLRVKRLLGVSISKVFIESIANLNGTEMNNYKLVKRNQFAYGPVTSRNGEKVSIACLNSEDECIISSSYAVFEIIDTIKLLPKYLMLWFKRPEFDRYARFHSHGSVREIFGWDELSNVELPIPSLQRQKEIVDAYETIESRIKLKRQINDNLEAQAATLYWQWIDDCSKQDLASEIPLGDIIKLFDSQRVPLSSNQRANMKRLYPYYGAASLMDYVDNYIFSGTFLLLGEDGSVIDECGYPILQYVSGKFWVNNHTHVIQGANGYSTEMLQLLLKHTNVTKFVTGAVQAKLNQENLNSIPVIAPNMELRPDFNIKIQNLFVNIRQNVREVSSLELTKAQILSGIASQS